jgi:YidC/Oxa1 family membrane protein insertase
VLLYWTTSNLWTMGQQFYVIRNNPAPGTPAAQAKAERDAHKAARRGESLDPAEAPGGAVTATEPDPEERPAPRQQPKRQSRQQRRKKK